MTAYQNRAQQFKIISQLLSPAASRPTTAHSSAASACRSSAGSSSDAPAARSRASRTCRGLCAGAVGISRFGSALCSEAAGPRLIGCISIISTGTTGARAQRAVGFSLFSRRTDSIARAGTSSNIGTGSRAVFSVLLQTRYRRTSGRSLPRRSR
jgi:hypothetical protein